MPVMAAEASCHGHSSYDSDFFHSVVATFSHGGQAPGSTLPGWPPSVGRSPASPSDSGSLPVSPMMLRLAADARRLSGLLNDQGALLATTAMPLLDVEPHHLLIMQRLQIIIIGRLGRPRAPAASGAIAAILEKCRDIDALLL
jgi:hypothetical protein